MTEKFPNSENVSKDYRDIGLRLDGNMITDLSNCTLKGNLMRISFKDNNLSRVDVSLFAKLKGLYYIDLSNNKLISIPERLFWNQYKLSIVYLANNTLTEIPARMFVNKPYLQHVDLSANSLTAIPAGLVENLQSLEIVDLSANLLSAIPSGLIKGTNLSTFRLGNNPWECNCHTSWMKEWLVRRRGIIRDLDEVKCSTGIPDSKLHVNFIEYQFNCTSPAAIVVRNALLAVGAAIVLCVITVMLIYVYRGELKILLYVHCNWHPFDAAENADFLDMQYDTFISYSGLDYKWVCFDLLPKLENHNPPYRVCVHDRDFMPGAYIEDNIMEAVESSRRMIMVLSQNYLKSDWCMLKFRAAHNKVLNDRTNYLILVLYDDVNVSELDKDMKLYIRTNTYLARSNKWFYDKLLYSMPTKSLQQLRKEMENKMVKNNSDDSLDHTNIEIGTSSSQFPSDMDALITNNEC